MQPKTNLIHFAVEEILRQRLSRELRVITFPGANEEALSHLLSTEQVMDLSYRDTFNLDPDVITIPVHPGSTSNLNEIEMFIVEEFEQNAINLTHILVLEVTSTLFILRTCLAVWWCAVLQIRHSTGNACVHYLWAGISISLCYLVCPYASYVALKKKKNMEARK